jgi:hypothetical protein
MKKILLLISLVIVVVLSGSHAYARGNCWGGRFPHGNYCEGRGCGWYGERQVVRTAGEARRILSEYYSSHESVKIGRIRERRWFFRAEIMDRNNNLTDIVIIDKRTGRIRSIY